MGWYIVGTVWFVVLIVCLFVNWDDLDDKLVCTLCFFWFITLIVSFCFWVKDRRGSSRSLQVKTQVNCVK
jgi:hypothetical protein